MSAADMTNCTHQCPACPDGYIWTEDGPTPDACPVCGGTARVTRAVADAYPAAVAEQKKQADKPAINPRCAWPFPEPRNP